MKRSVAAAVACLSAGLCSAYAAPTHSLHQAADTLGDALTNSIRDAIQGAVTKVHAHQAHHTQIALSPDNVLSAEIAVGRNTTKNVSVKIHNAETQVLAQRTSLRGKQSSKSEVQESNPYQPVKPLRIISNDLTPTAPMDAIMPGIESQRGGLLPPGYWPRVTYYPDNRDVLNPFPQTYKAPVPDAPENFLTCNTAPAGWTDIKGISCEYYSSALWCTKDGKVGPQWQAAWGEAFKYARDNIGAYEACCECGGGARLSVLGNQGEIPLNKRRLIAPEDRVPDPAARWFEKNNFHLDQPNRPLRPVQAPEDYVPLPIKSIAPADRLGQPQVADTYARYFRELKKQDTKDTPRGFSVRYYKVPPNDCSAAVPSASSIAMGMDYTDYDEDEDDYLQLNSTRDLNSHPGNMKPVYINRQQLDWPFERKKGLPKNGIWWAKWSGTLMVVEAGRYTFNLDIGFNTVSAFKIDGQKLLTNGQCRVSQDKGTCKSKGCTWNKDTGVCLAEGAKHEQTDKAALCDAGLYRSQAVLFGCQAASGEATIMINPASVTELLTIPAGLRNFQAAVESPVGGDMQMFDAATNTWVVKFADGIVNNQVRDGTYHGMGVSFSGANQAHEFVKLNGVTTSPLALSIMSYSGNPAPVKLIYSHGGLKDCPGPKAPPKGCEKYDAGTGQQKVNEWSSNMLNRYHYQCNLAWQAVVKVYPGGHISWNQFESVWSMAWDQFVVYPGGAKAWQIGFAMIDVSHNGYVEETEFMTACNTMGGMPGPAPAPAPVAEPPVKPPTILNTCLCVKVLDKASWPKDPFKGTGFNDSPLLDQLIGGRALVKSENDKGVMVPSPDGSAEWFFPKGTYYCVQAAWAPVPAAAPAPMVSTQGPAPSIANIHPVLVYPNGPAAAAPQIGPMVSNALIQDDLPEAVLANTMYLDAGPHCVEAMVMVTPTGKKLKLKYSGKDTNDKETVIPGKLLHCDPVIQSCENPLREVCAAFQPLCAGGPGPAPSPAVAMGR